MTPYVYVIVFWPLSHYDSDFWTFMFGTIWFLFDRYLFVVLIVLDTWDSWVYSGLLFHPDICCICITFDPDMVLIWIHSDVYLKNVILLLERWNKIMLFFPRKKNTNVFVTITILILDIASYIVFVEYHVVIY